MKKLNFCPMGSEFHNLKTGHYEHKNNATSTISHDCDSTEENVIKVIHFPYVATLALSKGPEEGFIN